MDIVTKLQEIRAEIINHTDIQASRKIKDLIDLFIKNPPHLKIEVNSGVVEVFDCPPYVTYEIDDHDSLEDDDECCTCGSPMRTAMLPGIETLVETLECSNPDCESHQE